MGVASDPKKRPYHEFDDGADGYKLAKINLQAVGLPTETRTVIAATHAYKNCQSMAPHTSDIFAELLSQTKRLPGRSKWHYTVTYKIEARADV